MSALACWLALQMLFVPVLVELTNGSAEPPVWRQVLPECAAVAAIFVVPALGMGVFSYVQGRRGRRRAESLIGEALLQAGQHADLQSTQALLQDAIRASPAMDVPDLERLADQLGVPLSASVGSAFRQAELQYLRELLASPEHLPKRVEGAAIHIERGRDAINPCLTAFARHTTPALGMEVTERTIEGRRTLAVLLTARTTNVSFGGVSARSGAFIPEISELPTSEDVVTVLDSDKRIRPDIARQFRKDVAAVLRTIVEFVRGRQIRDELDQVVIHERKHVPVYWLENVTSIGQSLVGGTTFRTHFWGRSLMADYVATIDMAPLSSTGRLPWDFKEDQVRFEYVPA